MSDIWHNIPRRYQHAKLEAMNNTQSEMIKFLRGGKDLIVVGGVGTGKTHLACAYLLKLCKNNIYARYTTEYSFADLFTLRHSRDAQTARDANLAIDHSKNYKLLVVDEVGKRELTKNQKIEIDELISERYNNQLRTIFISNLSKDDFMSRIGDRAVDRLRENGAKVVSMSGGSLRGAFSE